MIRASVTPLAAATAEADTLRFATAGSVDDGKSTLVGRLLHDSKSVLSDQLEAVTLASRNRGLDLPDLALLTDGLRVEREQGITIDVAYRYFATPQRRFIMADTPGHVQYTRNMVTGASTADLAVILADARTGVLAQTRRHAAIAALLRVPHLVLAVNKMDLVAYGEPRFREVAAEFATYATELGVPEITAVPISALLGDNVVAPSTAMDWYGGPTLLEHLETVTVVDSAADAPCRFPVQYVIRHAGIRYYAGQLVSGRLRVGDAVVVLPSGRTTTITSLDVLGHNVTTAHTRQSLTLRMADEIDVGRGDLLVPANSPPPLARELTADVCHLADKPLRPGDRVLLKHTTRTVRALVADLHSTAQLNANDLGSLTLRTAEPIAVDPYANIRATGAFVLIDPADGATLAAGMAR